MAKKENETGDAQSKADSIETISAPPEQQQQSQQVKLAIDDSQTESTYSTTARIWGSAEEINLDFSVGPRPAGPGAMRMKIDQRIVLNPWAAKRLAIALGQAVTRYEQAYGSLELDERKRRANQPVGAAPATTTA